MDDSWLDSVEPMVHQSRIKVPYAWSVGETGSRFLTEIRDNKRILGKKCEGCGIVFVPPRKMCHHCYRETGPWVEVGPAGTLNAFTVVRYSNDIQPAEVPFACGVIQLDGATTGLVHVLGEVDLAQVKVGMRLEPVFRENREGRILDITHFRPL